MKAYKCDICDKYCDDVLTVHGISQPGSHRKYSSLENTSADCCEACYDEIMEKIAGMMSRPPKAGEESR